MTTQSTPIKSEARPHFSLLATSFAGGPRPRNAAAILCGLWLLLFFGALFAPPLLDDADATHAEAARAMATTGDLVTLHVNGVRYLEKAPLPYWLAAGSFRLFGYNTFAAHLPQALAVLLLALLGHRWANQAFGARTGFYTALAILTSVGVFLFTRILIPEVLLSLLLGTALFSFFRAVNPVTAAPSMSPYRSQAEVRQADMRERPSRIAYAGPLYPYLMWASLALAVLSKGLVALVFFFAAALLYLWLTDSLRDWRRLRPATGLLLFFAIAAPWHVLAGLRNPGPVGGHGFFWFYFWNEHVLRFLGRREPRDYNQLPTYVYWLQHLLWLFPWSLFLPLAVIAIRRRTKHQTVVLTGSLSFKASGNLVWIALALLLAYCAERLLHLTINFYIAAMVLILPLGGMLEIAYRRRRVGLPASPFHRIDAQQRSILLLSLFALVVLGFFSLSTNQEYYTFPAYLPVLLLLAATITRAEQTYSTSPESRRWITFAHAALMTVGVLAGLALGYGLWSSRRQPFNPDVGALMAHRAVGSYTLSMSHAFDLTGAAFAAVRLPAVLAATVLLLGPPLAWLLRAQRRHIAATTAIALTGAGFLFAAQLAFARFAPLLSSRDFARTIQTLDRNTPPPADPSLRRQVYLLGDQALGSSIPFYLGERVGLVEGRSSSMLFGSTFPDVPPVFFSSAALAAGWGTGARKVLFIPQENLGLATRVLAGKPQYTLLEEGGKRLVTDRPLNISGPCSETRKPSCAGF